jgi:RimJ/RimL family protein N-acetyltransferase
MPYLFFGKIAIPLKTGDIIVKISGQDGTQYTFRKLEQADSALLTTYFLALSKETQSRFGPHPLTAEYAKKLCDLPQDSADRFILLTENQDQIIGYFIVEYGGAPDEAKRYQAQGIDLDPKLDPIFAPSMADAYQNKGLASRVMPLIIGAAKEKYARSLVLMGGTQETNHRAIAFYEKFGFKRYGRFQTDMFNYDMRLVFEP